MNIPTWKQVLNPNFDWHGDIDSFFDNCVRKTGYPYFMWNGRIYRVDKSSMFPSTWGYVETEWTQDSVESVSGSEYWIDGGGS